MKNKPTIKTRNRVEGQIARAAQSGNLGEALQLSIYGRKMTEQERAIRIYLDAFAALKKLDANRYPLKVYLRSKTDHLCKLFIDAVNNRNAESVRRFADEIERFNRTKNDIDRYRAHIIGIKIVLEKRHERMALRQLADRIGYITDLSPLRILAKKLKFPLIRGKVGKPKGKKAVVSPDIDTNKQ